jgi:hypothetical protein
MIELRFSKYHTAIVEQLDRIARSQGASLERAAQAVEDWLFLGTTKVMEKYNAKGQES